jgi:hypothetical protein
MLAQRLANKGGGGAQSNDWLQQHLYGETQAGQDIRHQYEGDVRAQQNSTVGAQDIQGALKAAADAARDAAAAMQKMSAAGQGSIVTGV